LRVCSTVRAGLKPSSRLIEPDLAPIDATFRVDLVEVGGLRSGDLE
jgi:hypothetical protein